MIIPAGYAQATHIFRGTTLPLGAVVTYGVDMQGFGGTLEDAADALYLAFQANVMQNVVQTVRHANLLLKEGPNATGPSVEISGEGSGSVNGASEVPSAAFLCRKLTNAGGRQARGRFYLPGCPAESVNSDGALADTIANAVTADLSAFLGAMNGADLPMVLLHGNAMAPTDVTSMVCDTRVATQRRRLRR